MPQFRTNHDDVSGSAAEQLCSVPTLSRTRNRLLMAALAAVVGVVALLGFVAAPASAATRVPFDATFTGSIQMNLALLTTTYSGTGVGTHVGHSQVQGGATLTPVSTTCFVTIQHATITAANGDRLFVAFADRPCDTAAAPNVFNGVGTYTITGGTGRFAGASGSGIVVGHGDFTQGPENGTFRLTLLGTVSPPHTN